MGHPNQKQKSNSDDIETSSAHAAEEVDDQHD